jgi:hypothetical protein
MKLQNLIHILIGIVCIGLLPGVQAVVPAPDGGYPGANTAEGKDALLNLTSGIDNTALGFQALFHNTTGNVNTAEGFRALFNNTSGVQNTTGSRGFRRNSQSHRVRHRAGWHVPPLPEIARDHAPGNRPART